MAGGDSSRRPLFDPWQLHNKIDCDFDTTQPGVWVVASVSRLMQPYTEGRYPAALDHVSVCFRRGELTAILDQQGAASAALLRCLTGEQTPASGVVTLEGLNLADLQPHWRSRLRSRAVGVIGPAAGLVPKLTVRQNLEIQSRRSRGAPDRRWLDRLVEIFDLEGLVGYRSDELVDFRRLRVACARSVIGRPAIVVGIDLAERLSRNDQNQLMVMLRRAAHELRIAVVVNARDRRVTSYADRTVALQFGRVVPSPSYAI